MEKHKALLCTLAAVLSSPRGDGKPSSLWVTLGSSSSSLSLSLSVLLPGLWPGCCEWENLKLYTALSL